jgi:hypothetical protein
MDSRRRIPWSRGRLGSLPARATSAVGLPARLRDVIKNQGVLAQAVARAQLGGMDQPCADPPGSSRVCRQEDLGREHLLWCQKLGESHALSRKAWEYTAICRALEDGGVLQPGTRALGFGVGREPLVSAFAAEGVEVVATDLPSEDPRAVRWGEASELAHLEALRRPNCGEEEFRERVSYRSVDMNAIPEDLIGFDFLWSSCALEHLGSIEAGARFVARAMDCLAPGGMAVPTTELHLDNDQDTISSGPTVAFRRRDIVDLLELVTEKGHSGEPFIVGQRHGVLDKVIDVPPYHYSSLALRLGPYRITSAVIIVRAAAPGDPAQAPT